MNHLADRSHLNTDITSLPVVTCPPAFASGAPHKQVKESTRRLVRDKRRTWFALEAFFVGARA